jgi:hypothetical protein
MKILILLVAAFFALLALRSLAMGGWFNFAGAVFFSAICWYLCNLTKRLH